MNKEIIDRYQNNVAFHFLVDVMVKVIETRELTRPDWFDAIKMADTILFESEMKKAENS